MINAQSISKAYGSFQAVRNVSFSIPKGQIVGLLGPNGAGKTTTIRMITGYLPPSGGSITVAGHDTIKETLQARSQIGYLPEATPLYPEMRVIDYLSYRSKLYKMPHRARRGAVERALTQCWLADVHTKRIAHLSKGYKQRVGLAAALLHNPTVLILDEPASGLDPTQILETRKLIRDLAKDRTVLVSSHILPEVERTCDRVLIIARGKLRADGTPQALLSSLERTTPPVHSVEVLGDARSTSSIASDSWSGEVSRIVANLKAIPGVAGIKLDTMISARPGDVASANLSHWFKLVITPLPGFPDLREPIARTLARGHVLCRDLTREMPTLEHLFTSIIEADPEDGHRPGEQTPEEQAFDKMLELTNK